MISSNVKVTYLPHTNAADMPGTGETFDMGFVDACRDHPWPLIDILCLYPVMVGSKVVIEHDLNLYRLQGLQTDKIHGIGPKYLYDQCPHTHRDRSNRLGVNLPGWDNYGNVFSLSLDLPIVRMEHVAKDAFALPWSLSCPIPVPRLEAVRKVLCTYYAPSVVGVFDNASTILTGRSKDSLGERSACDGSSDPLQQLSGDVHGIVDTVC